MSTVELTILSETCEVVGRPPICNPGREPWETMWPSDTGMMQRTQSSSLTEQRNGRVGEYCIDRGGVVRPKIVNYGIMLYNVLITA